ncbi:right-handed parallel beta-helix repeat-containing protein [Paenibacillus sp. GCM10027627]|uniref:right-handed parallel beta-helix repeat-containing protein n=1 Tax=unclassified Paenibacillus TaxID=185978 RepID=UPI0036355B73
MSIANGYVIELSRWGISNDGSNPLNTTRGINNALIWANANGYTNVKLPAGTYTVAKGLAPKDYSSDASIQLQSNMVLDLYGCVIQKETNGWDYYACIIINDKDNVTLLGGTIVGDRETHDFDTLPNTIFEGCVGVSVENGSSNVKLENMEITSFPGYSTSLTGRYSQLARTISADWEAGSFHDTTGSPVANSNLMRLKKFITLHSLTIPPPNNTVSTLTNGGHFVIWGNGYGSFGFRYDGKPVNLSKAVFHLYCYDDNDVFKGKIQKRSVDAIHLSALPAGTTKFKLAVRYDITQIIPSTLDFTINGFTVSKAIELRNCKIHDSYSLAVAITGAQQIVIENCEMYNIGNALTKIGKRLYPFPMAIDIEDGANINQTITIRNNVFRDNESLHISAVHTRNLILENNLFDSTSSGLSSGVVFQGTRGSNLLSQNNYYHCVVGTGEGNVLFRGDTFVNSTIQLQYEATYENCLFEDMGFLLQTYTHDNFSAGSTYQVTNAVFPTVKNGYYYVCIAKGSGATAVQPIWHTDGTDTIDSAGNVWRAHAYTPVYDVLTFKNCRFNYNKIEQATPWITRRGAVEFDSCKFDLNNTSGYFSDGSTTFDYAGKNSLSFTNCEFDSPSYIGTIKGDKVSFVGTTFTGRSDSISSSPTYFFANQLKISNCVFHNLAIKCRGNANSLSKSIFFIENRLYLNRTVRVFGENNEGVWISNFENAFIENNKSFMPNSAVVSRALTVYAEKYLKLVNNFFESANSENKLELFGAFRNAEYTLPIPKLNAFIDKNQMTKYAFLLHPTYSSQLIKSIGDGLTDLEAIAVVGSTDRFSTLPQTGTYALGQILYHAAPTSGGYIGWICTKAGAANGTAWTTGASYGIHAFIHAGGNVYKCTATGGSSSSNQPLGTSSSAVAYADGYSWIYVAPLVIFKEFGFIAS